MIDDLNNLPLLKDIDNNLLENLVLDGQIIKRTYHKGAIAHEQYTECYGIDTIYKGNLVAYSLSSNGSETVVFEFNKNNIIGANLLFGEQNKYPMNIYCTANCTVIYISKSAVKSLLKEYNFVMSFIKSLSLNSQGMNEKIAMYTQKSLRENLINYFLALSAEQNSNIIVLPSSKKQLAEYFGVQRPSLFRELKKMKDEKLISIDNKKITLLNLQF